MSTRHLHCLDDQAALAEASRIRAATAARWCEHATWFGLDCATPESNQRQHSGFDVGFLALFRYARGQDVPPFIVRAFLADLLNLMFAGLASGAIALPKWDKMADRPWAYAWRLAELRLCAEDPQEMNADELAHLLGVDPHHLPPSAPTQLAALGRSKRLAPQQVAEIAAALIQRANANEPDSSSALSDLDQKLGE